MPEARGLHGIEFPDAWRPEDDRAGVVLVGSKTEKSGPVFGSAGTG